MPNFSILNAFRNIVANFTLRPLINRLSGSGIVAASVVMIIHNNAAYLILTLSALECQLLPSSAWELIIIDIASQDNTSDIVQRYVRNKGIHIVYKRVDEPCSRVEAIAQALEIAKGSILVFLEDTQIVPPDFVLRHLMSQADVESVVIGATHRHIHTHLLPSLDPRTEGVSANPFLDTKELTHLERCDHFIFEGDNNYQSIFELFAKQGQQPPFAWTYFGGGNVSVPKKHVIGAGGYDSYFQGWGVEDIDLAYRLHKMGLPFRYEPRAITLRQVQPDKLKDIQSLNRNLQIFLCKYPNLTHMERQVLLKGRYRALE